MIHQDPKKVLVAWIDAQSHDEWTPIEDANELPLIESVGWLVAESEEAIVIAGNFDYTNDSVSCCMDIPRAIIHDIHELDILRELPVAWKEPK